MSGLASPDLAEPAMGGPDGARLRRYDVHGIRLVVTSDVPGAIERVHDTYGAFEAPAGGGDEGRLAFNLLRDADSSLLVSPDRPDGQRVGADDVIALFDRLVATVITELHRRGIYAVHAGAVTDDRGALVIAGKSGQGKTTLTLGLLSRGLGLLSDELALLDPVTRLVLPYRRSVHVRRPTIGLLPALEALKQRPRHELGGGSEWAVRPDDISRLLGAAALPGTTPLGGVIILDGTPDPVRVPRLEAVGPAVAALELLRGTWAASVDFAGTLAAVVAAIGDAPCIRLASGRFERTLDAILAWRSSDGR